MNVCPLCNGLRRTDGSCPACLLAAGLTLEASVSLPPATIEPPPIEELRRRLPQFEILALHGRGGMGAVYRAHQRALGRDVALKILVPNHPGAAERFATEARALARLSHPGIVTVYDVGRDDELCWLAMEFVDGPTLRQAMRTKTLDPIRALALIPTLCDALQYAHDQGVVHRDIKPENLLLDRDGRLKIADFGLARMLSDGNGPSQHSQTVMGTPSYMAPEQIEHPATVDHRADLFALGVVFYELLTGELPLGRFSPPSAKVTIDIRLDAVVLRALEKEPALRWQQAGDIRQQVDGIIASPGQQPQPIQGERCTQANWRGWPLIHVVWGNDPVSGAPRTARGIIAIGPRAIGGIACGYRAKGIIALGGMAMGVVACGGVSVGLVSLGLLSLGLVLGLGGLAVGAIANGTWPIGMVFKGLWGTGWFDASHVTFGLVGDDVFARLDHWGLPSDMLLNSGIMLPILLVACWLGMLGLWVAARRWLPVPMYPRHAQATFARTFGLAVAILAILVIVPLVNTGITVARNEKLRPIIDPLGLALQVAEDLSTHQWRRVYGRFNQLLRIDLHLDSISSVWLNVENRWGPFISIGAAVPLSDLGMIEHPVHLPIKFAKGTVDLEVTGNAQGQITKIWVTWPDQKPDAAKAPVAGPQTLPAPTSNSESTPIDAASPIVSTIHGMITDKKSGSPIADANIIVACPSTDMRSVTRATGPGFYTTRSAADGSYSIPVPWDPSKPTASVLVTKLGFMTSAGAMRGGGDPGEVTLIPSESIAHHVALQPGVTAAGKVVDDAGTGIAGVEVTATLADKTGLGYIAIVTTDQSGEFSIPNFPPISKLHLGEAGVLEFRHHKFTMSTIPDIYAVEPDKQTSLRVVLTSGSTIDGLVLDDQGNPVNEARVETEPISKNQARKTAISDTNGRFKLNGLSAGPVNLFTYGMNYDLQSTDSCDVVVASPRSLTIRLHRAPKIDGPIQRAFGLTLTTATPTVRSRYRHDQPGVVILEAGPESNNLGIGQLEPGDLIWMIGEEKIASVTDLVREVLRPGHRMPDGSARCRIVYSFRRPHFIGTNTQHMTLTPDQVKELKNLTPSF